MYKKTHISNQRRADQANVIQLAGGADKMTDDERYKMLKENILAIEMRILSLPKKHGASAKEKETKGLQ